VDETLESALEERLARAQAERRWGDVARYAAALGALRTPGIDVEPRPLARAGAPQASDDEANEA
jgi:hypothetical protein